MGDVWDNQRSHIHLLFPTCLCICLLFLYLLVMNLYRCTSGCNFHHTFLVCCFRYFDRSRTEKPAYIGLFSVNFVLLTCIADSSSKT